MGRARALALAQTRHAEMELARMVGDRADS